MKNPLAWMWIVAAVLVVAILVVISNPKAVFGHEIQRTSHEVPALKPSTELQLILLSSKC